MGFGFVAKTCFGLNIAQPFSPGADPSTYYSESISHHPFLFQSGTDDFRTLSAIYSQLGNAYFYLGDYVKAMQVLPHLSTVTRFQRKVLKDYSNVKTCIYSSLAVPQARPHPGSNHGGQAGRGKGLRQSGKHTQGCKTFSINRISTFV